MLQATQSPWFWIATVIALYFAIWGVLAFAVFGIKQRSRFVLAAAGAPVAGMAVAALLRGGAGMSLAAFALTTDVLFGLLWFRAVRRMAPRAAAILRDLRRRTAIHLVLLTGSVIFLIPFAWLVSTSLKEDSELSRFPPVWIPTQQTMVKADGVRAGLALATINGVRAHVAELHLSDTGTVSILVLQPPSIAGQRMVLAHAALTEIRHPAPVWSNYPEALRFLPPETDHGLVFLENTVLVSVLSIIGTLFSSSFVAFAFSRLRFPGRNVLFTVLLATMMLPSAVTMMPLFLLFRDVGWVDTLTPLWAPAFLGQAFYIFMLRQFFLGVPVELEEAARIDGASWFSTFWRILMPQLKPALAAISIMAFMGSWNDFRGPLIYISSPSHETLAYALQLFQTAHGGEPALLMAASTLVMIPVLLLFFFTQRYFIQGVTLTGIKG